MRSETEAPFKTSAPKNQEAISPLAGKPATKDMLVDVARLQREYFECRPDVEDPNQMVSFGTSGHRGSSLRGSFTEAHILAITQAICDYRRRLGTDGPLYMGKDTHALSGPAQNTALEVLAANGVRDHHPARRRGHSDAGRLARHSGLQPRPQGPPGGRHRRNAFAQSSRGWRLQVQPDQRRPGRYRRDAVDRRPGEPTAARAATRA